MIVPSLPDGEPGQSTVFGHTVLVMRALIETARPRQWVKNLFVAAPLVFSKHLGERHDLCSAGIAVALFCALSSAVYLWNDIVDLEKDRAHPRKCKRPLPSGRLSVNAAAVATTILAGGALGLGALFDLRFAVAAAAYLALNVAYSLWLKRLVYLDVLAIAAGFLLRVAAGALAIHVEASPYLLLCTGLLASFLGFGKRAHELRSGGAEASRQRPVLSGYRQDRLRAILYATGAATFVAYVAYTGAPHTVAFFHTSRMIFTAPCAAYGLYRFAVLVKSDRETDSPTEAMLKDLPFLLNLLLWALAVTLIIYFKP